MIFWLVSIFLLLMTRNVAFASTDVFSDGSLAGADLKQALHRSKGEGLEGMSVYVSSSTGKVGEESDTLFSFLSHSLSFSFPTL